MRRRWVLLAAVLVFLLLLIGAGWLIVSPHPPGDNTGQAPSDLAREAGDSSGGDRSRGRRGKSAGVVTPGISQNDAMRPDASPQGNSDAGEAANDPGAADNAGTPAKESGAPDTPMADDSSTEPKDQAALSGRVIDESGYGVAGASVEVMFAVGEVAGTLNAASASDGAFSLVIPWPQGTRREMTVILMGRAAGHTNSDPMGPYNLKPGVEKAGLVVTVWSRCAAFGRVLGHEGKPVEGVFVEVFQESEPTRPGEDPPRRYARSTRTDAEGRYRVEGIRPGRWGVFCNPRGLGYAPYESLDVFIARPGVEAYIPDVVLEADTSARVRLVKADGSPFEKGLSVGVSLRVQLQPNTHIGRVEKVGEDGVLRLANLEGYDQLQVQIQGYERGEPLNIVLFKGREVDLGEIKLKPSQSEKRELRVER